MLEAAKEAKKTDAKKKPYDPVTSAMALVTEAMQSLSQSRDPEEIRELAKYISDAWIFIGSRLADDYKAINAKAIDKERLEQKSILADKQLSSFVQKLKFADDLDSDQSELYAKLEEIHEKYPVLARVSDYCPKELREDIQRKLDNGEELSEFESEMYVAYPLEYIDLCAKLEGLKPRSVN